MLPVIVTVATDVAGSPRAVGPATALTALFALAPDVVHVSQHEAVPSADGWSGVVFVRAVDPVRAVERVAELVATVAAPGSHRVWSPDVAVGRGGPTAATGHVPLRTPEGLGRPADG